MEKNRVILIAAAVLAVVLYMGRNVLKSVMIDGNDALNNANVRAFLAMIREFESRGRYNVIYGGETFSDYSQHPHVKVPFFNPQTQKNDFSTAAGAYQITWPTWNTILKNAGDGDFSPASQDAAAVWLLKLNGALSSIVDGDFDTAIHAASATWASLPFTTSMQNHVNVDRAEMIYLNNGGVIA